MDYFDDPTKTPNKVRYFLNGKSAENSSINPPKPSFPPKPTLSLLNDLPLPYQPTHKLLDHLASLTYSKSSVIITAEKQASLAFWWSYTSIASQFPDLCSKGLLQLVLLGLPSVETNTNSYNGYAGSAASSSSIASDSFSMASWKPLMVDSSRDVVVDAGLRWVVPTKASERSSGFVDVKAISEAGVDGDNFKWEQVEKVMLAVERTQAKELCSANKIIPTVWMLDESVGGIPVEYSILHGDSTDEWNAYLSVVSHPQLSAYLDLCINLLKYHNLINYFGLKLLLPSRPTFTVDSKYIEFHQFGELNREVITRYIPSDSISDLPSLFSSSVSTTVPPVNTNTDPENDYSGPYIFSGTTLVPNDSVSNAGDEPQRSSNLSSDGLDKPLPEVNTSEKEGNKVLEKLQRDREKLQREQEKMQKTMEKLQREKEKIRKKTERKRKEKEADGAKKVVKTKTTSKAVVLRQGPPPIPANADYKTLDKFVLPPEPTKSLSLFASTKTFVLNQETLALNFNVGVTMGTLRLDLSDARHVEGVRHVIVCNVRMGSVVIVVRPEVRVIWEQLGIMSS
ncbi:hypothetical protein HDU76_008761 [Blyttiomyces sp. JEL0837]|nr:hypothetical protein HDU76_008761 [Blyttiomyces sp. JEL0837]